MLGHSMCNDLSYKLKVKDSRRLSSLQNKCGKMTLMILPLLFSFIVFAGPADKANYIHERLTGVIPSAAVLADMVDELNGNDVLIDGITGAEGAALIAIDNDENDAFYNATLKNWVAPWTNRDQDAFVSLNDYTATVIGLIRDERDFREVLFDDVLYISNSGAVPVYETNNNDHFEAVEVQDISLKDTLVRRSQSEFVAQLPTEATAGVMTSRAAAEAFFIDGTNRAMFRFTLLNHMCSDLEQIQDSTRVPDRIRQDVSRSPGGDSRVFLNNCISCHGGLDPMAQAFAYYDFDNDTNSIIYNDSGDVDAVTGTRVNEKYHINATTFPFGYATIDDRWNNYWREGPNSVLGWGTGVDFTGSGSGNGAKTMGAELANSEAFAQCQVKKVFENVCLREPINSDDLTALSNITTSFKIDYNLKNIFAATASYCSDL